MPETAPARGRNQRNRTRKDLLVAAARLLKQGRTPSMEEADEALVSRATAYRYFRTVDAVLVEAPLDIAVPDPHALFAGAASADAADRVDRAEAALHDMCRRNEAQLRLMLAHSLGRELDGHERTDIPIRQNRRTVLIEAALAPVRGRLPEDAYQTLCAALALIFGTESMIVFKDVLRLTDARARQVKSWTVRALVRAALEDSKGDGRTNAPRGGTQPSRKPA